MSYQVKYYFPFLGTATITKKKNEIEKNENIKHSRKLLTEDIHKPRYEIIVRCEE